MFQESVPCGQELNPIVRISTRSANVGSSSSADATSVVAPVVRMSSRSFSEWLREVLTMKSAPSLRRGVRVCSGTLDPANTGGGAATYIR